MRQNILFGIFTGIFSAALTFGLSYTPLHDYSIMISVIMSFLIPPLFFKRTRFLFITLNRVMRLRKTKKYKATLKDFELTFSNTLHESGIPPNAKLRINKEKKLFLMLDETSGVALSDESSAAAMEIFQDVFQEHFSASQIRALLEVGIPFEIRPLSSHEIIELASKKSQKERAAPLSYAMKPPRVRAA